MIADTVAITFLLAGIVALLVYVLYRVFVKPRVTGFLECRAYYRTSRIEAFVEIYKGGKTIKKAKTPCLISLAPGSYLMKVKHMSETLDRDIEIEAGQKKLIKFKLPSGQLECHAYHDSEEIQAVVEIFKKDTSELLATRMTPFTINLEVGEYSLKTTYTPKKET